MNSSAEICRTCLETCLTHVHLNQTHQTGQTTAELLLIVTGLQITDTDNMPMHLCYNCVDKINMAYEFRLQCHRSDIILKETKDPIVPYLKIPSEHQIRPIERPTFIIDQGTVQILARPVDDDYIVTQQSNIMNASVDFDPGEDFDKSERITLIEITDETIMEVNSGEANVNPNLLNGCNDNEAIITFENCPTVELTTVQNQAINLETDEDRTCVICNLVFSDKSELKNHKKIHKDDTLFECTLCDKVFTRIYSIRDHMATHSDKKEFLCSICGKNFHLATGLRQHMKYHDSDRPHQCKLCDKSYRILYLLNDHIRRAHSKDRYKFSCNICGKNFTVKSSLTAHLRIHTGERQHICKECGQTFTRSGYLNEHMRKHTNEPPSKEFHCTYENCDKKFLSKNSLLIHIRHTHTKERPYACKVCPKAFCSLPGLRDHQKTHTGDKPETCPHCKNKFVNKQSLKKHLRLHTGEKPYPCAQCGERFLSSSRLSEHIQSKHMERRHECPICLKKFHLRRTMRGHIKAHSKEIKLKLKPTVPEPEMEVTL